MQREQWKSQLGFILAAVGSAVGLGNIWRFSYMAYSNGGGAFLIPYVVALLTAGIPLLILEFAVGHERIGSAPLAYAKFKKSFEWLGWWSVIFVMFGIVLYYSVVISWCVNYFFMSFDLSWGSDPNAFFFNEYLKISKSPGEIGSIRGMIFVALIFVWVVNWFISFRGIQKGVELANKIFMPLLLILMAVLVFWSLTLDGAGAGIKAYLTPDWRRLADYRVWVDAYTQIFFTLSLGFGIMIAYSSYLPEKANLTKGAFITAFLNSGFSLFAGFAVFSVLGFMATTQGVGIKDVVSQSIGLAFVAYPKAVSMMPGGQFFGAIFFLSLVVAGLSSSISIVEAFSSAIADKFGFNRKALVSVVCVAGFFGSIIFTTQAGLFWLDIVDHFLTHYGLVIVGIGECLLVGYLARLDLIKKHVNQISSIKLGIWFDFMIKLFIPGVLMILVLMDLKKEFSTPYEGYSWTSIMAIGMNWLIFTLAAAFVVAARPWKLGQHKSKGRSH